MTPDSKPFRATDLDEATIAASYYNTHDLREMYTRENTERRRAGAHTLRRYLTQPQDKLLTAKMTKFRDEYQVANNDDVVIVFVQDLLAQGKEAELDPKLVAACKAASVPKRSTPV